MLEVLQAGLERLDIQAEKALCRDYLRYIELLAKWNVAYNLTAVKEPEAMLNRHLLDSLSVHSFVKGEHCLDIGTGAGLPGMILALAQPEKHWTLLDSNQKKIRFLRHVIAELTVDNVELVHARIETFKPVKEFDTIICRAFAPLPRMLEQTQHLLTTANQLLAMKGKQVETEVDELGCHEFLIKLNDISLSGEEASAKLVQIRRSV
tara:strand:- start:2939 stop:3559 length:621 start_codon:yes stop_codon:yes gene_type:complete